MFHSWSGSLRSFQKRPIKLWDHNPSQHIRGMPTGTPGYLWQPFLNKQSFPYWIFLKIRATYISILILSLDFDKEMASFRAGLGKDYCWEVGFGYCEQWGSSFALLTVQFVLSPTLPLQLTLASLSSGDQTKGTKVSATVSVWSL